MVNDIELIMKEYNLNGLDNYYIKRIIKTESQQHNRKRKKKTRIEMKTDFRNKFEYLLWSSIMTFISYHFYKGYTTT